MPGAELYLVVLLYFKRMEIFELSVSTLDEVKEVKSCFATFLCIETYSRPASLSEQRSGPRQVPLLDLFCGKPSGLLTYS